MSLLMLAVSFITSGISAIAGKALIEYGLGDYRDLFQLVFYLVGTILGFIFLAIQRQKTTTRDLNFGLLMGVIGALSFIWFLVLLTQASGIVAFPIRGVGSMVLTAIISIIAWHEKLSRSQWIAVILSIIAMWLIY